MSRLGKMSTKEMIEFVNTLTTSVAQDTLKLQTASKSNDCLELTRAANSFGLGYKLLAAAEASLEGKDAKQSLPARAHIVQSRVITFAARVRAEEYFSRRCASFAAPADKAEDPRYARPVKIETTEYTQAVIDARLAAEANLANAVAAGMSRKCPDVFSAMQSIQLFVPYLEKLATDVRKRPQALGPRASRRALEVARGQLVNAGNKLYREIGAGCQARAGIAPKPPIDEATPPVDGAPAPLPEVDSPAIP